jgi:DNA-binding HxlR family transcriptional regulator
LRAHLDAPLRFPELRARIAAREASLRAEVKRLRAVGALERRVLLGMPYTVEDRLTESGIALLGVADLLRSWLLSRPEQPAQLGTDEAKAAIKALSASWRSGIRRELTASPSSLGELSDALPENSYPSLARCLSAMKETRQVETLPRANGRKPYSLTAWGRQADTPLAAASAWELLHRPFGPPKGAGNSGST